LAQRDTSIDIIRGIAIFTMAAANAAPYGLHEPHPFWFRLYGSFAAPVFIALTGMMIYHSSMKRSSPAKHLLLRVLLILLVAAVIDIAAWKIMPFTTVDVLYLIAVSTPVVYAMRNTRLWIKGLFILLIFSVTPILQKYLGYTSYPTEYYLDGEITTIVEDQTSILHHWVIDGWFPLFPWLGFALLGSLLAEIRWKRDHTSFSRPAFLIIAFVLIAKGIALYLLYPVTLITRNGYSELFYPPTYAYISFAAGVLLLVFYVVDLKPSLKIYKPLSLLGECSLLMYVWHSLLIAYVIQPYIGVHGMKGYALIYGGLLAAMLLVAWLARMVKRRVGDIPYFARFLLGG
jgi:uncharacterized membrane protein